MQADPRCDRSPEELGAFIDGELPEPQARAVGAHMRECPACAAVIADWRRQGRQIRLAGREALPDGLSARVRAALAAETSQLALATDETAATSSRDMPTVVPIRQPLRFWIRQAAAMAAVCVLSVLTTWSMLSDRDSRSALTREVMTAHVRALLQDSPVQVASSDQHTVKPWFTGRLEFSPDVKDLASQGFPLVGGRLDYIDGHRAAVLVYKHRLHVIDVFMSPAPGSADAGPRVVTRNGYNLVHWTRGGVNLWAVSDLNADELLQLQALI